MRDLIREVRSGTVVQPGTLIADRFRIEELAGTGGMGVVYRAVDERTDRLVALKILRGSPEAVPLRRFAREARQLESFAHPAIVRFVDHGVTASGEPFFAMDWIPGTTLAERIASGPMTLAETLAMARSIASALAFAHARGIVHRDVKPANIVLARSETSRAMLLDFGIARAATDTELTREGTLIGTAGYMSPEQARGERSIDARADVFALGCVMFHCLTGEAPYGGEHPLAWLGQLLTEPTPRVAASRPDLGSSVDAAVARLMATDRTERPLDGTAVMVLLDDVAREAVVGDECTVSDAKLSTRERRVVSMIAVQPAPAARPSHVATLADDDASDDTVFATLRIVAHRHGGIAARATAGRLIATWTANEHEAEPVLRAAHAAMETALSHPDAAVALVTGTTDIDGSRPASSMLDRAFEWIDAPFARAALESTPIVRIDAATAALLGGRFALIHHAKGFWLAHPSDDHIAPTSREAVSLIGRDRELGLLLGLFDEVVAEQTPRAIVVTAPAGGGKSRLAREFVARVRARARVLTNASSPVAASESMSLAKQSLRQAAGVPNGTAPATARARLASHFDSVGLSATSTAALFLFELLGAQPGDDRRLVAARNDPRIMYEHVLDAFSSWLARITQRQPLVLVAEDTQWLDGASLRLLGELQRRVGNAPWMILALERSESGERSDAWRDIDTERLALAPLSRSAAIRLAEAWMARPMSRALIERVADRAAGNAFVIEQLARHIEESAGNAVADPGTLPDSVFALIDMRLARLDPGARRVLRAASVYGTGFTVRDLVELVGGDAAQGGSIDAACRALESQGLFARTGGRYAFRHELMRETAYGQLLADERITAHRWAARWLSTRGAPPLEIAEHFERGCQREATVPFLLEAARAALDANDTTAVDTVARRALANGADDAQRGECHILVAQAAGLREDWRDALDAARRGCALVDPGSASWFVGAGGAIFAGAMIGDFGDTPSLVAAMRTQGPAGRATGPRLWGLFLAITGLQVFGLRDEVLNFLALAEATLAQDPVPDPVAVGWFHLTRARIAVFQSGDLDMAVEASVRACEHMDLAGGSFARSFASGSLGLALLERGEVQRAVDVLAEACRSSASSSASLAIIVIWYARALEAAGRLDDAFETIDRIVSVAGASLLGRNARARRASVWFARGFVDEALREIEAPDMGDEAVARGVGARIACAAGDLPRAFALCEEALAIDARQAHAPSDHAAMLRLRASLRARLAPTAVDASVGEAS